MTAFTYSTFLALTNLVLDELNEVNLTSVNFSQATGFQQVAQNAVNKAIRDIQNQQWEWPFNHVTTTQALTIGVPNYALPDNCKSVNWDTFILQQNLSLPNPQQAIWLPQLDWNRYNQYYAWNDQNATSSEFGPPIQVIRSEDMQFYVTPFPDQLYSVQYEYWTSVADMVAYSDLASVPSRFDYVIVNGAMKYCYRFRENLEAASAAQKDCDNGIKDMRYVYIRTIEKVYDNRICSQWLPVNNGI